MMKNQIFNELKRYKKFNTDRELANYIGISSQVLSSWRKDRNIQFNKILNVFPEIDANWLVTGKGKMLKSGENDTQDETINFDNQGVIVEKFLNEIAEQRKLTQQVVEQNSTLLRFFEEGKNMNSK